jgi:beta-galactosidase
MLAAFGDVPALVIGPRTDILARTVRAIAQLPTLLIVSYCRIPQRKTLDLAQQFGMIWATLFTCAGIKGMPMDVQNPSRRDVLRGGTALGAVGAVGALAVRPPIRGTANDHVPVAREYDFDLDWKFVLVNPDGITDPTGRYTNAYQPGFDDAGWQRLDLPHDWSIHLNPVDSPDVFNGNGFFQGGLGWYRKTFTLPSWMTGKQISVEFDGVYSDSYVYLNGELLGNHPYAYTGFNYELTGKVHTDGVTPNVIAVQATNQIPSSRWYSGSGIYRNVSLIVTDPVHIARHGTFVTTPDLPASGTVHISIDIRNDGRASTQVSANLSVRDLRGEIVAHGSTTATAPAGGTVTATTDLMVDNPALWSVDDPVLYTLEAELRTGAGAVDTTHTTFGFRYFSFDPNGGFALNGEHLKLQGVDLHATQGPLGAVVLPDALERQMRLMKSMGVNALRTAHNPPAPELTAVCERVGVLMMVEAFDCWHTGKVTYDYHLYFDQWSDSDIKEMVLAHRNSPAVVLWSIGNETPDTGLPDGPPIAARLIADVKSLDTSRPVVMGSDRYRSVPSAGSPPDLILRQLDGLGVNYNTAMSMDGLHAAYPSKFFFCSETSSETSTRSTYQRPDLLNTGENYTPGKQGTSSYDNNLASWCMSGEYELKKDRDRLFWQGGFLWAGQDYIGEPTPYDVFPVKSSFFGAVDTAGFAKDAYYLYRSQWSAEPMVHIVPMDWTSWSLGSPVSVWVYSNVASVELFLNGQSLGVKSFDVKQTTFGSSYLETTEPTHDDYNYPSGSYTSPNGSTGKLHLTWTVPFSPGVLSAVAHSPSGAAVATDSVRTAGPACSLALSADTSMLTADGQSVAFVTASVVDRSGTVVPSAENDVSFSVFGAGILAGTDNGREESASGYCSPQIPAFRGNALAIVRATQEPGRIRLTASSPGLAPATLSFRSVPVPLPLAVGSPAGAAAATTPPPVVAPPPSPAADASYSGDPTTIPAMMLDGDPSTGWSNYYDKAQTANVLAVSSSDPAAWVSLTWASVQQLSTASAIFITGGALSLPASIAVSYWDGAGFVPVDGLQISWATASGQPTTLTFDQVRTTSLRFDMTNATPATASGFLRIASLSAM